MTLDYNFIKEILEKIENGDETIKTIWHRDFKGSAEKKQEYKRLRYHYKFLFDNQLVKGKVDELLHENRDGGNDEMIQISFSYSCLTLKGREFLKDIQDKKN